MSLHTSKPADSVSSLGETQLIASIRHWLGNTSPKSPYGIGDDCAVLSPSRRAQLVTVDPVIAGVHFDDSVPARSVGAKLLKRNLSDIAAMGGRPRGAVIALALSSDVSTRWLENFYRGLADAARAFNVPVIGGDIARQPSGFTASLTLIGEATGPRVLVRQGARLGDWIYVTGALGGSLLGHHYRFTPRLAESAWLAARKDVRSMMDLSDGLAKDLPALTPAGAVPALVAQQIPISAAARTLARRDQRSPLIHALSDGEDYELVFTLAARADCTAFEAAWKRTFSTRLSCIGRFSKTLSADHLNLSDFAGYEHLR